MSFHGRRTKRHITSSTASPRTSMASTISVGRVQRMARRSRSHRLALLSRADRCSRSFPPLSPFAMPSHFRFPFPSRLSFHFRCDGPCQPAVSIQFRRPPVRWEGEQEANIWERGFAPFPSGSIPARSTFPPAKGKHAHKPYRIRMLLTVVHNDIWWMQRLASCTPPYSTQRCYPFTVIVRGSRWEDEKKGNQCLGEFRQRSWDNAHASQACDPR